MRYVYWPDVSQISSSFFLDNYSFYITVLKFYAKPRLTFPLAEHDPHLTFKQINANEVGKENTNISLLQLHSTLPHHLCIADSFFLLRTFVFERRAALTAKTHKQEEMHY